MDIKKIADVSSSVSPVNRREKEKPAELDFKELLKQANFSQKSIPQAPPSLQSYEEAEPTSNMVLMMSQLEGINQTRLKGIEATEKTLFLLEEYQNAMANPDISLKRIDLLIQSLSEEVNGLHVLSERLPLSDPLHKILNEVGIVSTVEIERFRRGDYI